VRQQLSSLNLNYGDSARCPQEQEDRTGVDLRLVAIDFANWGEIIPKCLYQFGYNKKPKVLSAGGQLGLFFRRFSLFQLI
jgi:hypothetical protein